MSRDKDRRSFIESAQRRDVLKAFGAAGIVGLAGCQGDGGDDGDSGGGGLSVNVQLEDTETDSNPGVAAAESLINAGMPFVCGTASSGVNVPVCQQVLIPNQVVGCSPSSTALSVTNLEDDDYIFRTAPSDRLQGRVMAAVSSDRLSASSVATLYVNNDYGQQLSERYAQVFEDQFDGEVTGQTAFNQGESSYTSVIQEALSGSPDVLNVIGYPEDGAQLFRDYYSTSDQEEDVIIPDGLRDPELPGQVGNPMDNVTGTAPAAGGPARDAYTQLYEDEYGEPPGVFSSQSYDSTAVGILAGAAAGENSGESFRDQLRNIANPDGTEITPENFVEGVEMAANGEAINYQGASSAVNFDDNGDPASAAYAIWQFTEDGTEDLDVQNFEGENPDGSGPSADDMSGSDAGHTIDIGILLPETGNLASTGESMINAAQLPPQQVNDADIEL